MTITNITENNCECFGVTFLKNGMIKVQKLEHNSNNKNIIYEVGPMETLLGKSQLCHKTDFFKRAKKMKKFLMEILFYFKM